METRETILVLGAYGLAGRAIVERLLRKTPYTVLATGRDAARLEVVCGSLGSPKIRTKTLDALVHADLGEACQEVDFVINAVGPFARSGAAIAQTVLESGKPYLDCANEQQHYHHLKGLHDLALRQGVPMITAAGAIPGLSTLFIAYMMKRFPEATGVECCWAQLRHAYPDSGLASMMGGILEALAGPVSLTSGNLLPVVLGRSVKDFELPEPFGLKQLLEVPTIDALTLPQHFQLHEYHTWFYLGDMPLWLLDIVRLLQPQRRPWAYRIIESIMRRINNHDTAKAISAGVGPEALLMVSTSNASKAETNSMLFQDGAVSTACLPVHIADRYLKGEIKETGLLTPIDLIEPGELPAIIEDILFDSDLN